MKPAARARALGLAVIFASGAIFVGLSTGCARSDAPAGSAAAASDPLPPPLPMPVANNAVAAIETSAGWSVFSFLGIGYDGRPAEPWGGAFAFDPATGGWVDLPPLVTPTMDHRGIVIAVGRPFIVGGMTAGQRVTDLVAEIRLGR